MATLEFQLSREGKNTTVPPLNDEDPLNWVGKISRVLAMLPKYRTKRDKKWLEVFYESLRALTIGSLISYGRLQQIVGTEFKTPFGKDLWVQILFEHRPPHSGLIITDVRFKVEAECILNHGGILLRMEGDPANVRATSTRDPQHISEVELDNYPNFTQIIDNSEVGVELLDKKLDRVFNH